MGARENKVETYLDEQITAIGGITRKWVSPGRTGVPDRIVIINGDVWFVELKTMDDGRLKSHQEREQARLQSHGAKVLTLAGHSQVDEFIYALQKVHS